MKVQQIVTFLGFLAAGASANPGGYDKVCKKWEWDYPRCDWCPYDKDHSPREPNDLEARSGYGYGRTCKKHCPDHKKNCKKYEWDYSNPKYSAHFDEYYHCPKGGSYKVTGKIVNCGWFGRKQCLVVKYKDWDKWSDKEAFLGIYGRKKDGSKYKWDLNFNKYCHRNKCVVPVKKIPGHPHLCDKKIWVGIDDDQCKNYGNDYGHGKGRDGKGRDGDDYGHDDNDYGHGKGRDGKGRDGDDYGHDDNDYRHGKGGKGHDGKNKNRHHKVKYIPVEIDCKGEKKCQEYCCCA